MILTSFLCDLQAQFTAQDSQGSQVGYTQRFFMIYCTRSGTNYRFALFRSYIEDFRAQHYQYESHREIFMAAPSSATDTGVISLRDLIDFISHVADCYPGICKDFPQQLIDMLMQHHLVLETELREKLVGSLVLLKKKDLMDSATYVDPLVLTSLLLILTATPGYSTLSSPSSSLHLARPYALCSSRRFSLSCGPQTQRPLTTS